MSVGVAIIGCGLIGTKRALALPDGMRLLSVYDVDPRRAKALAEAAGGMVRIASSPADAFATYGVTLGIVATLHSGLAELAGQAVESGLHVLVEKPGGCRPSELVPVREAAARKGRVVKVGFNHRFHPAVLRASQIPASDGYGPLMWVRARYGHGGRAGYEREWRADPSRSGGGELLDQGIHLIDLVRHLAGDVDLAFAEPTSDFWSMPVEDNAFLCLKVKAGGTAWLHASWTEWRNLFSFEIAHRTAKIEIEGLGGSYGTERLSLHEMRPEMGPPDTQAWEWRGADDSWRRELEDLAATLAGTPGRGATLDDAIAALEVVEEAYRR